MLPISEAHIKLLASLHESIRQAIADLPSEALDWIPAAEMNSIGVLVAHVAGSERYWIGDVAGGESSGRVRDTEFENRAVDAATLITRLDTVLAHSRSVLERLTMDDLAASHLAPAHGQEYSVAWAVLHALEHTALHVGHIQLTRQLWEQQRK